MYTQAWGDLCDILREESLFCLTTKGKLYCQEEIDAYNECKKQSGTERRQAPNTLHPPPTKQNTYFLKLREQAKEQKQKKQQE